MIDLHSHILPGIDDGASDIDASVELVRELYNNGVTDVIATPHYIDETIYTSSRSENLKLLNVLRERVKNDNLPIRIYLGNEIYIFPKIEEYLKSGVISSLADSKYILVELPMNGDYSGYADVFLALIRSGYNVVLAHPERYTNFQENYELIQEVCEMGVLLQCNVGSFAGQYGKSVFKVARRLAKEKKIFGMGSDIHHVHPGLLAEGIKKLSKFYSADELDEILINNPKKIIVGEMMRS